MSLLKSSVNYVATGRGSKKKRQRTPLQTRLAAAAAANAARSQGGAAAARSQGGAAAARSQGGAAAAARPQGGADAARDSRWANRRAQNQERQLEEGRAENIRLQQRLADNQEDLLIAEAAKLLKSGKKKRLKITALKYRVQQLQSEIPQLVKNTGLAFTQLEEAQKALDRVKQTYDQSVAQMEKAKKEATDIPIHIEFLQDDLESLEAEYNQMQAAATLDNSFDGNLAAHMQYLSLSDPVCV